MKFFRLFIMTTLFVLTSAGFALAETVVIVNAGNPVSSISQADVKNIFLGKKKQFPDGSPAKAVDNSNQNARTEFYDKVVGKDLNQVKAYWAKKVFTGKGNPPTMLKDSAAVVSWVKQNQNGIGFIDGGSSDAGVKAVLTVP